MDLDWNDPFEKDAQARFPLLFFYSLFQDFLDSGSMSTRFCTSSILARG